MDNFIYVEGQNCDFICRLRETNSFFSFASFIQCWLNPWLLSLSCDSNVYICVCHHTLPKLMLVIYVGLPRPCETVAELWQSILVEVSLLGRCKPPISTYYADLCLWLLTYIGREWYIIGDKPTSFHSNLFNIQLLLENIETLRCWEMKRTTHPKLHLNNNRWPFKISVRTKEFSIL